MKCSICGIKNAKSYISKKRYCGRCFYKEMLKLREKRNAVKLKARRKRRNETLLSEKRKI